MGWLSSPSPPPAPDYTGAAEATAESSRENVLQQTYANRPNQRTPWGDTSYSTRKVRDPATGKNVTQWTQKETLNPILQRSLESEQAANAQRNELGYSLLGRQEDALAEAPSFDEFGTIGDMRQGAEDSAYDRITSRLDPQQEQGREAMEVKLRGQGLQPGSEAYDRAMESFERSNQDAYGQARAQSVAEGRAETTLSGQLRQQEIGEYLTERQVPLNEVNALMSGQQVQQPNMPQFQNAAAANPTDYSGAARDQYGGAVDAFNIGQAGRQSTMSGLMNMGSAAMMFCDRRLKTNIKRIGSMAGYPLYSFDYLWGAPGVGPMADEVNSEAVSIHASGFQVVDLNKLRAV